MTRCPSSAPPNSPRTLRMLGFVALSASACFLRPAEDPYPALEREDLFVLTTPHRVGLIDSGWEALAIRTHLIRTAQSTIDFQTFIWSDDEVGRLMAYELIQAARRGVRVRLLIDRLFSDSNAALAAFLATADPYLELRHYNPAVDRISPSWLGLLAEAILRRKLRQSRPKSRVSLSGQNPLDLVPNSSAHVVETSRNGEDR